MKKAIMILMVMMMVLSVSAKDDRVSVISGDGKVLTESGKTATLEFDYTNTVVEKGDKLMDYLKKRGEEFVKDWPEMAASARNRFIEAFNKKNKKGVQVVTTDKADLKMKIVIEKLDLGSAAVSVVFGGRAGSAEITGKLIVSDNGGNKLAEYELFEIRGNGSYDFTEEKRLGTCYENVAKMIVKASK
ncbi:MAG: hypothetical protein K6G32_09560 [Prevotella sp.]|nr:hypothetical protein [Prevotella sp.]